MVNRGDNIWVIYPEYFDVAYSQREGRKVPKKYALSNPKRGEIITAARELNLFLYEEDASHPRYWSKKRGRVIVRKDTSKLMTLKALARLILEARQEKNKQ